MHTINLLSRKRILKSFANTIFPKLHALTGFPFHDIISNNHFSKDYRQELYFAPQKNERIAVNLKPRLAHQVVCEHLHGCSPTQAGEEAYTGKDDISERFAKQISE